jgi:hypothetical protein
MDKGSGSVVVNKTLDLKLYAKFIEDYISLVLRRPYKK